MPTLFDETEVGAIKVKNRIFMAPLTRNRANDDGTHIDLAAKYYTQRSSAGLIITEATQISPRGKGYIQTPGIYNSAQTASWKKITNAVHDKEGKIVMQLWHVGRISHTKVLPEGQVPLAPSAIQAKAQTFVDGEMVDVSKPKAMSIDEIKETIEEYRQAAQCAKDAGFDGVEIHAANGYLINQFLSDHSNKREDEYGGSAENRARFFLEVFDAVCSVWDENKIGIRFSPTGKFNDMDDSDPIATYQPILEKLNNTDLAYIHLVEKFPGMDIDEKDRQIIKDLRAVWQGFYIANGDYSQEEANQAIESGHAHAITFGRIYIANPDLVERFKKDASLNEPDHETFYGGGAEGYTDYPFLDGQKEAA